MRKFYLKQLVKLGYLVIENNYSNSINVNNQFVSGDISKS